MTPRRLTGEPMATDGVRTARVQQSAEKFCRITYSRPDRPTEIVVEYTGDETAAAQFPHGNAAHNRDYVRTQPHVLQDVRSNPTSSSKTVYQSMITSAAQNQHPTVVTRAPRNVEQVRNTKKLARNQTRLSRDALYNLHEFAYDSNFVHRILTFPDLSVVCYNPAIVDIFTSLLSASTDGKPTVTLTYDTTFNLGDFYLSVLLFRETDFDPSPIIPLAFLIHERKLESTHAEFFQHIRALCPQLDRATNAVMITDNEAAITGSIRKTFPNLSTFLCWNHLLQVNSTVVSDLSVEEKIYSVLSLSFVLCFLRFYVLCFSLFVQA